MNVTGFLDAFGGTAYTLVAFILALSVIVTVHEYGHYIVGRWCGIQADVFSLGFGKPLVQRTDKRGTVWQIALLPLGGYVKFRGDVNVASGPAHVEDAPRDTLYGAPLWARAATVAAGPVFNFIFSAAVFSVFYFTAGELGDKIIVDEIKDTPYASELREGDVIQAIDGVAVNDPEGFFEMATQLPDQELLTYDVLRDGTLRSIEAPHPFPVIVGGISPKSAASDAGLQVGDVVTHVNGTPTPSFTGLQEIVKTSDGAAVTLTIWRGGETVVSTLKPRRRDLPLEDGGFETRWLIGVTGSLLFETGTEPVGAGQALIGGITQVGEIIQTSLSGLYHMVTGAISACNLSGPVGIAESASVMASQGTTSFIWFIAVLSTAIGMLNLFPIPMLDGGHLVFYGYEAVRGKPLPERAVNFMMTLGISLVAGLMLLGLGADLFCV